MKFGYTIVYVEDVPATLAFYEKAFGFAIKFLHESNQYGELDTGATTLSFAAHPTASGNLPGGYEPLASMKKPAGIEVGFLTNDVPAAFDRAVAAGATPLATPKTKPWGQVVAYVRCSEGTLVEICTPVG